MGCRRESCGRERVSEKINNPVPSVEIIQTGQPESRAKTRTEREEGVSYLLIEPHMPLSAIIIWVCEFAFH